MKTESGYHVVLGLNETETLDSMPQCLYNLRVYPTTTMEEMHKSNDPIVFGAIILGVFLFTSLLFVVYDALNQRRYRIVNTKAVEQTAVVSSLFPEQVRNQVVGIVEKNKSSNGNNNFTAGAGTKSAWKAPSHQKSKAAASSYERLAADLDNSEPIADLYPDCTVLFADIAGFTAWSSERSPCEVFKLLEAIYGAFDRIAKKKGVFKVETIGDCYVAVTGLPKPQEQHAVIMARFAADCMTTLSGMMHVLVEKLGPDTANLTMRFGLHSVSSHHVVFTLATVRLGEHTRLTQARFFVQIDHRVLLRLECSAVIVLGSNCKWHCNRARVCCVVSIDRFMHVVLSELYSHVAPPLFSIIYQVWRHCKYGRENGK